MLEETESYRRLLTGSYFIPLVGPTSVHFAQGEILRGFESFVGSGLFAALGAVVGLGAAFVLQSGGAIPLLLLNGAVGGYLTFASYDVRNNSSITVQRRITVQRLPTTPQGFIGMHF